MRKGLDTFLSGSMFLLVLLMVFCVLTLGSCVFCDFPCCRFIFSFTLGSSVPPATLPESVLFQFTCFSVLPRPLTPVHLVSVSSAVPRLLFSLSLFEPLSSAQYSAVHHWYLCHYPALWSPCACWLPQQHFVECSDK